MILFNAVFKCHSRGKEVNKNTEYKKPEQNNKLNNKKILKLLFLSNLNIINISNNETG